MRKEPFEAVLDTKATNEKLKSSYCTLNPNSDPEVYKVIEDHFLDFNLVCKWLLGIVDEDHQVGHNEKVK